MITAVTHIGFTVTDVEKSVEFYRRIFGMKLISLCERPRDFSERVTGIKGAHLKIAYVEIEGYHLELIQYLSPPGKKLDINICDVGSFHVALNVDNLEEMLKTLKEKRVHIISSEPVVVPAGPNKGNRIVYLKDPDGIIIELIEKASQKTHGSKTPKPVKPL